MNILAIIVVALVTIGSHSGNNTTKPLYAVMVGDTSHAEQLSTSYMPYFGASALDGVVYTQKPDQSWRQTVFIRPSNLEQINAFYVDPTVFIHSNDTPEPDMLGHLRQSINRIDYIVMYFDGSIKVYLTADTPETEANLITSVLNTYFNVGFRSGNCQIR